MYSISQHSNSPENEKNSKRKILKIAFSLFSRSGFLGVSMQDIAREAGLTKPALYYYFQSKKELYHQVLQYSFGEIFDALRTELSQLSSQRRKILCLIQLYLKFNLGQKNLLYLLPSQKIDSEVISRAHYSVRKMKKHFWSLLKKSFVAEKQYPKEDLKVVYTVLFSLMNATVLENFASQKKVNLDKESRKIFNKVCSILKPKVESNYKSIS